MPAKCISDGCQRNPEPHNKDGYCGVCHKVLARLQQTQGARYQVIDGRRNTNTNMNNDLVPDVNNAVEFPDLTVDQVPPLDMTKIQEMYRKVINGEAVENNEVIKLTFGMMLHVVASLKKVDDVKILAQNNRDRITALEAKVGGSEEVATALGLALQNLPLPIGGAGELQNVRNDLAEIKAQGVDVN